MSKVRNIGVASFCKWKDLVLDPKKNVKVYRGTISWPPANYTVAETESLNIGKPRFGFGDSSYHWTSKRGGFAGIWLDKDWRFRGVMGHLIKPPSSQFAEFKIVNEIVKGAMELTGVDGQEANLTVTSDNSRVVDCFNNRGKPKTLPTEERDLLDKGKMMQTKLNQQKMRTTVSHLNSSAAHILAVLMRDEARMEKMGESVGLYIPDEDDMTRSIIKTVPGGSEEEDFTLVSTPDSETLVKLNGKLVKDDKKMVRVYELDSESIRHLVGPKLWDDFDNIRAMIEEEDHASSSKSLEKGKQAIVGSASSKSPEKGKQATVGSAKNSQKRSPKKKGKSKKFW